MMRRWKKSVLEVLILPGPWFLAMAIFEVLTATMLDQSFLAYMIGLFVATIGRRYDIVFFRLVLTKRKKSKTTRISGLE